MYLVPLAAVFKSYIMYLEKNPELFFKDQQKLVYCTLK